MANKRTGSDRTAIKICPPSMLRSDPSRIFLEKYGPLARFGHRSNPFLRNRVPPEPLVFLVPFLRLNLFRVPLMVVEVRGETARYRQFQGSRTLPFEEIASCRFSTTGLEIGYMRLKRFVWPPGGIYTCGSILLLGDRPNCFHPETHFAAAAFKMAAGRATARRTALSWAPPAMSLAWPAPMLLWKQGTFVQ
jgi:hypothetical protein